MSEEWSGGKSGPPDQGHHPHQPGIDHMHPGGGDHSTNGATEAAAAAHHHASVAAARYGAPPPPGYPPPDAYNPPGGPGGMIPPPPVLPEAAAAAAAGYPPLPPQYQQPWHPYGPPPPYHASMYPPPHYPSPYGPPPPYPQHMSPYGYDPAMAAAQQGGYGDPNVAAYPPDHGGHDEDEDDEDDELDGEIGSYGAAARMKMYVKSKIPTRQEILDRRARKNAQSRARASKLRDKIVDIKDRDRTGMNDDEVGLLDQYENRRQRKNDRSRERAIEKKSEIDRILNKPERKRSKIERAFLETALTAKQRKNEGDRLRRQRIKVMGKKGTKMLARSPYGDPSIPVSPLPTHQYGGPGSVQQYGGYSSPHRRAAPPGVMEAPVGGVPLPFVPPPQQTQYGGDARSQLHLPQNSSQVEQRRNPDGSLSISIGGARGGEEMGDMGMLLYGEGGEHAPGGDDEEDDV